MNFARELCCIVLLWTATILPALAAEDGNCRPPPLSEVGSYSVATVNKAKPKAIFIRNASDKKGCPADTAACRDNRYLVPGDLVLIADVQQDGLFDCVTYVSPKGDEHSGWIAMSSLEPSGKSPVAAKDWIGNWSAGGEQNIEINRGKKPDEISISGHASYGAEDPDRVKRGAINSGDISAAIRVKGETLSFASDGDKTVPVDKAPDTDCKVWMNRTGPFLMVDDNNACGGMNVTFRGIYRVKK